MDDLSIWCPYDQTPRTMVCSISIYLEKRVKSEYKKEMLFFHKFPENLSNKAKLESSHDVMKVISNINFVAEIIQSRSPY